MHLPAKKSLGQHFLTSKHVLGQIIEAAQIQKGQRVLEIGPGTGILTQALLDAGAKVLAVEKDTRAIEQLKEKFAADVAAKNLYVIHDDILEMRSMATANPKDFPAPYAVVANIPYYITGAILESFLEHEPRPTRMILLVQKEVAERIVAKSDKTNGKEGIGKESILSISVKAFGTPKIIAKVPRGAFNPPPTVESAILSIENISDKLFTENNLDIRAFFTVLKAGFAHKRKILKSNLKNVAQNDEKTAQNIDKVWKTLNLDEKVRAEDLTLEKWLKLGVELGK